MESGQKREIRLNEQQKLAVLHKDGPLLVLAGAGAGKTRVITERVIELIKSGVSPSNILAITFTNKAAAEMRERVTIRLKEEGWEGNSAEENPFLATFHSLAVRIIRENHAMVELPRFFSIYDRADSLQAIKEGMKAASISSEEWSAQKILSAISRQKSQNLGPEEFIDAAGRDYYTETIYSVWEHYRSTLKKEKALDFDDLLIVTGKLLEKAEIAARYHSRWQYIHIDEYQDTNRPQYLIAKLLAEKNRNICAVGDIDQMIYGWRGADLKNILNFEKDYPELKTVVLEENYRSTKIILDAANAVIDKNKQRFKKNLFTKQDGGEKITLFTALSAAQESYFVAEKALELARLGIEPEEIAVLYRTNFQSRLLEDAMLNLGVPYQLVGTRYFERKEVKDVLSYVKTALNPESWADFKRAVSFPSRGIGKVSLLKIIEGKETTLVGEAKKSITAFRALMERIRQKIETSKPSEVMRFVIKESGIETALDTGSEEDGERLLNIRELGTVALRFDHYPPGEGILHMLEEAALSSDQDNLMERKQGVKLMTIHAAKGLEFDYCFITGLEEGLFPVIDSKNRTDDVEEERRLCYVALTRARKKIFMTRAMLRTIFGIEEVTAPSRFLAELPAELVEENESEDPFGGWRGGKSILFD